MFAIKTKARTVVWRGEKSPPSDPGPGLRLGRKREKETINSAKIDDGMIEVKQH